jgi:hypothetical protein
MSPPRPQRQAHPPLPPFWHVTTLPPSPRKGTHPQWATSASADPLVIELEGSRYSNASIRGYFGGVAGSPQMLRLYGASARSARARRTYDRIMDTSP